MHGKMRWDSSQGLIRVHQGPDMGIESGDMEVHRELIDTFLDKWKPSGVIIPNDWFSLSETTMQCINDPTTLA